MDKLDQIADGVRSLFQELLREFVRDKNEREKLAAVLGRTPGHIKQMVYKGEGGLDSWAKAFAYYYKLDLESLENLRANLRQKTPVNGSDKVWFEIRDTLGAPESDLFYLAKCAREAYRIKCDLENVRQRSASPSNSKPRGNGKA
jgi:hypothetical protein